jgi:hypothetical protein
MSFMMGDSEYGSNLDGSVGCSDEIPERRTTQIMDIDVVMINMRIIANVGFGEKLTASRDRILSIDRYSALPWVQPMIRAIWGDNRRRTMNTILETIRCAINAAEMVHITPNEAKNTQSNSSSIKIAPFLMDCILGLTNLNTTYAQDKSVGVEIGYFLDMINAHLENGSIEESSTVRKNSKRMPKHNPNHLPSSPRAIERTFAQSTGGIDMSLRAGESLSLPSSLTLQ